MDNTLPSLTGRTLSHYTVGESLGQGGMGIVYKAHDNRLHRTVALKALPQEFVIEEDRRRRFIQEARAASALNHPNIVTIHDIDSDEGVSFIVMELVDGLTLAELLRCRRLDISEVIEYALQIADALASTHIRGIVHRDLKPANIMVTRSGHLKILDFGLAKLVEGSGAEDATTRTALTETGTIIGTAAYMSPEQIDGGRVDSRSDIFSFGALLYEMTTGKRAFRGENAVSLIAAILHAEPDPIRHLRPEAPPELEAVVSKCLRKAPEQRFSAMEEIKTLLTPLKAALTRMPETDVPSKRSSLLTRVASAVVLVALIGTVGWFWRSSQKTAWAYEQVPQIRRLVASYDYKKALALTEEAKALIPSDTEFDRLLSDASWEASVNSVPTGASVRIRPYGSTDNDWQELGQTPLSGVRIPRGALEWKFSKANYQEAHLSSNAVFKREAIMNVRLARSEDVPPGMVYVPGLERYTLSLDGLTYIQGVAVRDYYLDQFEVTNQQFKKFVDAGGYSRHEFWKERFLENGHEIPWEQAVEKFTDKTGQPGPKNWELKDFPAGQADFPVGGVSWYEAAAYVQFVGKILPPVAYWNRAARPEVIPHLIVPQSNFNGTGPVATGKSTGMNPFGTYDMAGNVREWCFNEAARDSGQRYILGAGWDDPIYLFGGVNAVSAFDRAPTNGIRLAKFAGGTPGLGESDPMVLRRVDFNSAQVASDADFKRYQRYYAYEKTDLNSTLEKTWDEPYWIKQKISFDAGYNKERMVAFLFLPKSAVPPYQTLVYFPGLAAQTFTSSDNLEIDIFSALVRSGRAVIYPIYKGTYERGEGVPLVPGGMVHRDLRILQFKDLARSLDYLETRSDFDMKKLGFYGISWGGGMGAFFPAVENRLKLNILLHAGFRPESYEPEVDPINFVTRVKIPTLMLSGKYDYGFPVETNQLALLRLLGTPAADKKRIPFEIGHQFLPTEFAKASLAWLEKYFGPVTPAPVK